MINYRMRLQQYTKIKMNQQIYMFSLLIKVNGSEYNKDLNQYEFIQNRFKGDLCDLYFPKLIVKLKEITRYVTGESHKLSLVYPVITVGEIHGHSCQLTTLEIPMPTMTARQISLLDKRLNDINKFNYVITVKRSPGII